MLTPSLTCSRVYVDTKHIAGCPAALLICLQVQAPMLLSHLEYAGNSHITWCGHVEPRRSMRREPLLSQRALPLSEAFCGPDSDWQQTSSAAASSPIPDMPLISDACDLH